MKVKENASSLTPEVLAKETAAAAKTETKKADAVTEVKKTEKEQTTEKEAPAVTAQAAPAKKTTARKTAEKKTETKTTAKKTAVPKKTAAKTTTRKTAASTKAEPVMELFVQYDGNQVDEKTLLNRVLEDCEAQKIKVQDIKLYVKPEENACYYVANGNVAGKVDLY